MNSPSGILTHLSSHQWQQQLGKLPGAKISSAVMKTSAKAARAQNDQGKSSYSTLACLLLLLLAGILVKFAAFTPIFHVAHWN
jgi:hypothetical protein